MGGHMKNNGRVVGLTLTLPNLLSSINPINTTELYSLPTVLHVSSEVEYYYHPETIPPRDHTLGHPLNRQISSQTSPFPELRLKSRVKVRVMGYGWG